MMMRKTIAVVVLGYTGISIGFCNTSNAEFKALPLSATLNQDADYSVFQFGSLSKTKKKKIAHNFGLTPSEYQQYLYNMTYTPDKYFYDRKGGYPLWDLAAHSENNPALFKRYIRESIVIAHQETSRMLKVNVAFYEEAHKLYPDQYPVMTAQMHAAALKPGDVIRMYCQMSSATCSNILPIVLKRVHQVSGARLDLFIVGAKSKKQIVSFAKENGITPGMIKEGQTTINFGDHPFKMQEKEANSKGSLPLPYITVLVNGHQKLTNLVRG